MKKAFFISLAFYFSAFLWGCSDKAGDYTPLASGDGSGRDSLANLCDGECVVDSASSYTIDENSMVITVNDTEEVKLNIVSVDGSSAVLLVDTSVIPEAVGEVELVLERITGSGTSLENELWRLDTLKFTNDDLGIHAAMPLPGDLVLVLDSETGKVISAYDTSGMEDVLNDLLVYAVASCPLLMLGPVAESDYSFLAPVDSIDTERSSCDTTWGYKNGADVYVTSNGSDSLFIHNTGSGSTTALDLAQLLALIQLMGGMQGL